MSIDVEVIPGNKAPIYFYKLKNLMCELLIEGEIQEFGGVIFQEIGKDKPVSEEDCLVLGKDYELVSVEVNTLVLSFMPNDPDDDELEIDMLEDYGRNLEENEIKSMSEKWAKIGFTYKITSKAGRHRVEPRIFWAIVGALTALSSGDVIVMESDIFSLPVGVYKYSEFIGCEVVF
ncbi:hypothetical protein [Microbulbifer epialgicus]|uniref:Immunity protein 22 n=1 Tax=Microbulbifer epialgicus TaxID=393907 RepID=A0ABV4NW12_9GAMM